MNTRNTHRITGIVLLLPLVGWVITGFIFFVKPGYGGAYEFLRLKTYPVGDTVMPAADPAWLEFRYLRTILGPHLIVRDPEGWHQLDPASHLPRPLPGPEEVGRLVADAMAENPARYGTVESVDGAEITTTTNVRITLDWETLGLSQRGGDTDLIDTLYKIHYLQWTGIGAVDRVLGVAGLVLLALLSFLGFRLAFRR